MALRDDQLTRLLGAIETNTLVFLCGAGLSIPMPSGLPSAVAVSQRCFDKWNPTEPLDPALRNDVDRLAGYFHARGDFETVFVRIVPWDELVGAPNCGHAAVADLLITRAAHAALSANFDVMIERWAEDHKIAMQGALNGQEAAEFTERSNPLVKFHGCLGRARNETLWTQGQLTEPTVQDRVRSVSEWMNLHLPGKHLVVVGFWTDCGYLNNVLADALTIGTAASVMVIDPSSAEDLQGKAPALWARLNASSRLFEHVPESGADVLDQLRTAYSRTWARKFFVLGETLLHAAGDAVGAAPDPGGLSGEELYDLRRDAEGVPYNRAARHKAPEPHAAQAALAHIKLLNAGGTQVGAWIEHRGIAPILSTPG
jgi:hypothetical protein